MTESKKEFNLSDTHVPDKVYAYNLQIRHALYELLKCNFNESVSIEVYEDVAVHENNGDDKLVQLKSALSKNNPVADRSKDLWKTFYNWLVAVNIGEIDIKNTNFIIFLNKKVNTNIVDKFHRAKTDDETENAYNYARTELYGENGTNELAEGIRKYVDDIFNPINKETVLNLIRHFKFECIDVDYSRFLYSEFCRHFHIEKELEELAFDSILGWLNKKISELIENSKPMLVSYEEFKLQLIAINSSLVRKQTLIDLAPRPSDEEIDYEYKESRIYIQQLELIELEFDELLEAISNNLRASTNRTQWAVKGLINYQSLPNYREDLIQKWKLKKRLISLNHDDLDDINYGKNLYYRCLEEQPLLDGMTVPSHFAPGCYQELADDMQLGWHKEYKEILKPKE